MPSVAALELIVGLKDNASKGLQDIGEKGGLLGDLVKGGALAAGGAILGLGGVMVAAVKAASDEQKGIDRLGVTLKKNIPNFKGNEDAAEGFVTKMERLAFSDDDARDSLNKLIPRTHDLAQAQNLTSIAADLARQKNIDLSTATDIVGKVYGGNIGILGRYGIQVDKGATSTQALAAIQAASAGQADAYANSAAGAGDRIQTSLGDILETLGHTILPAVSTAMGAFADLLASPGVQGAIQAIGDGLVKGVSAGITAVGNAITTVQPIVQPFIDAIGAFFTALQTGQSAGDAFGTLFNSLGTAIGTAWTTTIQPALGQLWTNITTWISTNGASVALLFGTWAVSFGSWVTQTALPWLLSTLGTLISQVLQWVQTNGPGILAQLGIWAAAFRDWVITTAWPWLVTKLGELLTNITGWISTNAPAIFTQLGIWAQQFGDWVMKTAWPAMQPELVKLLNALGQWLSDTSPQLGALITQYWNQPVADWPGKAAQVLSDNLGTIWLTVAGWISGTVDALANKLTDEWIPAAFRWIGTSAGQIGDKLTKEWIPAIGKWISEKATEIGDKFLQIGQDIVLGIMKGVSGAWTGFTQWLNGLIATLLIAIKQQFGIGSPSKVMADEVGVPLAQGIGKGFEDAWPGIMQGILRQIGQVTDPRKFPAYNPPYDPRKDPKNLPPYSQYPQNQPPYDPRRFPAYNPPYDPRTDPRNMPPYSQYPQNQPGGGGGGGRVPNTMLSGWGSGSGVTIQNLNIYAYPGMDGGAFASSFVDALEEEISHNVRIRRRP